MLALNSDAAMINLELGTADNVQHNLTTKQVRDMIQKGTT
jgi:hypothetical protein